MKAFLFVIILLLGRSALAWTDNRFALEANSQYNYHYFGENTSRGFCYGTSFLVSRQINKLKLSGGIYYAQKNYIKHIGGDIAGLDFLDYKVVYFNVPVVISFMLADNKNFTNSIKAGPIFNYVNKFSYSTHYIDGRSNYYKDFDYYSNPGITLSLGYQLQYKLKENLRFGISPWFAYVLFKDHIDGRPTDKKLPDDRIGFSLQLGIEYLF